MLKGLHDFFDFLFHRQHRKTFPSGDLRVHFAALCLIILKVDGEISEKEISHFKFVLKKRYNLTEAELKSLLDAAKSAELEAIDYYRFASNLKRHLNMQQRLEVIAILRDLSSIDGDNSELEDDIVWRIADVFGIKDWEVFINEENSLKPSLKAELIP